MAAAVAVAWVARQAAREPVVAGLGGREAVITRREALAALAGGARALAGCGASARAALRLDAALHLGRPGRRRAAAVRPGEPLVDRTELGPRAAAVGVLATFAHLTDAHVLDASSPARVTFLDRLGPPFESTFRPQEALTAQVLAGAVAAIRGLRPALVIQGGDLIDNAQNNELTHALSGLAGGPVQPGADPTVTTACSRSSTRIRSTTGPMSTRRATPGSCARPSGRSAARGSRRTVPVLGDHDTLVAGEIVSTPLTRALAVGDRALWELPTGLTVPRSALPAPGASPDGPPSPARR